MSYQVFARKYRPQNFDELVGQDHVARTLKNAIEQNRLAQAYLFVGPRGTGKTSTARIFAKALNCVNGPTIHPCGVCPQCVEIASGRSLNVLEFDAASNTQVEKIREIILDTVQYAPSSGKYKLYIVDEVHMLSASSFNALLKTLEEPPAHVKFVFATTNVEKVPTTILSRCQRFDLRRIPAPLIAKHLLFIAEKEKIAINEPAVHAIAKAAEGGLRDAESMLDQLVAFCGNTIAESDVLQIFGLTAQKTVADLCDAILDADANKALMLVNAQAEAGRDLGRLLADCIAHLRNLLIAKTDLATLHGELDEATLADLKIQADRVAIDRLFEWIEQFAATEQQIKWSANKKLHLEIAVIKAIQTLGQTTLTDLIDTLTAIRNGSEIHTQKIFPRSAAEPKPKIETSLTTKSPEPLPTKASEPIVEKVTPISETKLPAQIASEPALPFAKSEIENRASEINEVKSSTKSAAADETANHDLLRVQETPEPKKIELAKNDTSSPKITVSEPDEKPEPSELRETTSENAIDLETVWLKLLQVIRQQRPLILTYLKKAQPLSAANGELRIALSPDDTLAFDSLQKPANQKLIESIVSDVANHQLVLRCETREGLVVESVALPEKKPEPERDPMKDFKNDPLIRKALEVFKAEIQPA